LHRGNVMDRRHVFYGASNVSLRHGRGDHRHSGVRFLHAL
jgi:hypothetical protein